MNYYIRRIGMLVVVWIAAVTLAFFMYRMIPSGPVEIVRLQLEEQMMAEGLNPREIERVNNLVEVYTNVNPEAPPHIAFYNYWHDIILYQDFGVSIRKQQPVFDLMFSRMPWSIFISVYGLAFGVSTSLLFGAVMAYYEGGKFDQAMTALTITISTVPYYIYALGFLIVFAFILGWFPSGGRATAGTTPGWNYPFVAGLIEHATLPILSGFVAGFGGSLGFRGNCIRQLGEGYIRVGRLRGLTESRLAIRYVGRNALLPIYTGLMMSVAGIFGSGIILEIIFQYQAMGLLTFNALMNRDYPLLMGAFVFFTTITLFAILVADLTYGIIDPRITSPDERESY